MTCTFGGALRRNFKSSPCSAGRSLPTRVKVLPVPCTFARPPSPFSEMASSMRPLYSATLGLGELSVLLDAAFAGEGPTDFGSAAASGALDASSRPCTAPPALGPASELSEAARGAGSAELDETVSLTWALCRARAASKTGLILFAP